MPARAARLAPQAASHRAARRAVARAHRALARAGAGRAGLGLGGRGLGRAQASLLAGELPPVAGSSEDKVLYPPINPISRQCSS